MRDLLIRLRRRQEPEPTQAAVARRLGVTRVAVNAWEQGERLPSAKHLQGLLDLYGATDGERLEAWRLRAQPAEEAA
jgi:transcriptional regulator with XRE-family HTH domain